MTFRTPDPNAKFIDPEFYTNPNDMRWSGVECEFFWVAAAVVSSIAAGLSYSKQKKEERRAKEAAKKAKREAEAAARQYAAQQRAAQQAVAEQKAAMEIEKAEQEKAVKEQQKIAADVAEQARVAELASKRSVTQVTQESQREAVAIADQQLAEQQAALTADEKVAGSTVGRPGIARTKVTSPVPGGYGGTEKTKVNPTGLNI